MNKEAIEKLKSETKIGDKFDMFYFNKLDEHYFTIVVSKVTDTSIYWVNKRGYIQRESWNTVLGYINKGILKKKEG